jgi:type IV secretion system protein VirB11
MHSGPLTLASRQTATEAPELVQSAPGRDTALREFLRPIDAFLADASITEICINRPGEVFTEGPSGWQRVELPTTTLGWCKKLAQLIATFSSQKVNEQNPMLSGSLPDGERVQVTIPPACELGTISITIRKPSLVAVTPAEYEAAGFHDEVPEYPVIHDAATLAQLTGVERKLLELRAERRYWDFYALAIRERKNIVISGATGSGKTTFGRALVNFIPEDERLLTIEDVREMFLPNHPNRVHLLYSEGGQGTSEITGKTLLQACLRMKPDRVLLAELRSKVAYDYIVNISSGHPGSITTVHAGSTAGAFEMLMLRVKESDEGQSLKRTDIQGLLRAEVDIVLQVHQLKREGPDGKLTKVRRLTEIHYDPAYKRSQLG